MNSLSMNKTYRFSLAFMLFSITTLNAAEVENKQLSIAFLEYLADQVEVNGELIGPIDMQANTAQNNKIVPVTQVDKHQNEQGINKHSDDIKTKMSTTQQRSKEGEIND